MKVGILAYCSVCNFGAQLQLLSTYCYLLNNNHTPIIIDWTPFDLEKKYESYCPKGELELMASERMRLWKQTKKCRTSEDVANTIKYESIDAIIIGSDAVAQHRSLLERIKFPTKHIYTVTRPSSDTMFPNPFWGTFNDYLDEKIPIAVMSASSQDSRYVFFEKSYRKEMFERISQYKYLSVRDNWTQDMFRFISNGKIIPKVTPDPVFAFNYNVGDIIPSERELRSKFNIDGKYLLISFHENVVSNDWIEDFRQQANEKGFVCVNLPYADKNAMGKGDINIELPLSPLDWYALIKYSSGYIGENMHPIVVSLHNAVPFFSFDNYGLKKFNGLISSDHSSKIKHILKKAGLEKNRVSCIRRIYLRPKPTFVLNKIINFKVNKASEFAENYYKEYKDMMNNIISSLL